jgi:hypothetical protein
MNAINYGALDEADVPSFKFTQQSYMKPGDRTDVGTYEYDPTQSNVDTAVWNDKTNKKTHVSNRGSKTAYDWFVSDLQIASGAEGYGDRFKRAVDTTRAAHDKYGYDVSTSGHSLGGKASSYTTEQLGNEDWYTGGTGFNQGTSAVGREAIWSKPRRDCNSANPPAYCAKQTNIKYQSDPISMNRDAFGTTKMYGHKRGYANRLARFFSPTYRTANNFEGHSLQNFSLPPVNTTTN